jgi:hypothetical protein
MPDMEEMIEQQSVIVAVPADAALDLEREGLAELLPAFRGPGLEAVVAVGTDASTLITLLQAPDAIKAFAAWIRARCVRSGTSIEITVTRGGRKVRIGADGDIAIESVADFLAAAFKEADAGQ